MTIRIVDQYVVNIYQRGVLVEASYVDRTAMGSDMVVLRAVKDQLHTLSYKDADEIVIKCLYLESDDRA